jgi:four helix bundle protein
MGRCLAFEDLIAWRKARELLKELRNDVFSEPLRSDFRLAAQIRDCADSIMANIAEGFERGTAREFRQFLAIAKGSCGELQSHIYVAFDFEYMRADRRDYLLRKAREVSRIIGGLRQAITRSLKAN